MDLKKSLNRIKELEKDSESNNCINGNCSRCGNCCTPFLPMNKSEVNKVKEYLKQHPEIEERALNNKPVKGKDVYIRCCFYDAEEKSCMVYPARPGICKLYKCDQSQEIINTNKLVQSTTAKYNTTDLKTINDFRNLLWKDATLIIAGILYFLKLDNLQDLYTIVKDLGRNDLMDYVRRMILKEEQNG